MNRNVNSMALSDVFSNHAEIRSAQRCIDKTLVNLIVDYGEAYHAGNGAIVYWLNRKRSEKFKVIKVYGSDAVNIAAIISSEGIIITVMHCVKRLKNWKHAA